MFVPGPYRSRDVEWIRDVVRENPLALLTTNGPEEPWATHLPVIAADASMSGGSGRSGLEGVRLLGHMNRANPHWRALTPGTMGAMVFTGSSGYISPVWYETEPAAPTWDFVAVHAHVRIDPIASGDETLEVVRETARRLEDRFGAGWDQRPSVGYFRRILHGVGAFAMDVVSAEGMHKLSQEKDQPTRERICSGLRERGRLTDSAVANDIARAAASDPNRRDDANGDSP